MQRFELLTKLPSRLSCIILQDWLNLKSVIALDSAFCFHSHRRIFTELVQSDEYFVCEQVTISRESKFFSVLQRYGKKLRSVVFARRLTPAQEKLLGRHCQNLTHMCLRRHFACTPALWNVLSCKIVWVDLSASHPDRDTLVRIPQLCPCLRTLGLADSGLTDHELGIITEACPHIAHLGIADNSKLTDSGVLLTVVNLKSLRGINIVGNTTLTDASLAHIYTHCAKTLHTLQMNCRDARDVDMATFAPAFSFSAIHTLLVGCTQLRTLHIAGSVPTCGAGKPGFPLYKIKTLVLGTCNRVNNIMLIAESCANLQTLVTDALHAEDCIESLVSTLSTLKEVHLSIGSRYENTSVFDYILEYAVQLVEKLKENRPGLVAKCTFSRAGYSENDVMSM